MATLEDGTQAEVGLVGREGMVGLPLIVGIDTGFEEAFVQAKGSALQMEAGVFRRVLEEVPILQARLNRYNEAMRGRMLIYSAGVELAYMLFTPGPDEAIEPVLLGLASSVLIIISDETVNWKDALVAPLLCLAIGFLFFIKARFVKEPDSTRIFSAPQQRAVHRYARPDCTPNCRPVWGGQIVSRLIRRRCWNSGFCRTR